MKLPPCFALDKPRMVCCSQVFVWVKIGSSLVIVLKGYGFLQSYFDYSLFIYSKGSVHINVLVYVDDLLISENNSVALKTFKGYLNSCFYMKDLGVLKYFWGIKFFGYIFFQRKYALDIILEMSILGAKPIGSPIEQHHSLTHATEAF
ncbi:Retrovirus-related Pol polyprotein from transposon TNT 1-94 [Gossypium australe]|uniref:Retrovirus-related Pol polyprotein from transposon TNT 1-94 n=1 Tax=Gossypium australe TaxID=47621 RepID=A0A5B6W836_9ROSI|nr:Retrovirus-related Pol polyprotein from transposon TNT 1-94 [Gossypium australe]